MHLLFGAYHQWMVCKHHIRLNRPTNKKLIFLIAGYSCRLLTTELQLITMNTSGLDQTRSELSTLVEDFGDNIREENDVALIVDGQVIFLFLVHRCQPVRLT